MTPKKNRYKNLTIEEQTEVRTRIKNKVRQYNAFDKEKEELIKNFLLEFAKCDSIYKDILKEVTNELNNDAIDMRIVNPALKHAGYSINRAILEGVFGRGNKIGTMSCKWIRNRIVHNMDEDAILELDSRKNELFDEMKGFQHQIEKG